MKSKLSKISLILVFAMVIQLFGASFIFAQDEAAQAPKTPLATEEYKFFNTLGMLDPTVTLYEGEAITRGQFAYIAARLIGFDGESNANEASRFADVYPSASYAAAVNYLYDNGVVRGTGNSNFQPEQPIIFNDASAIIVKILGYDKIASAKYGAYPLCNIRMADSLDIYLDMTMPQGTASITSEEALIMFKNAIYAPMALMSVYGDDASTYTYEDKNTLLYVYHDIARAEGVVTDDSIASITGETALKNGGAIIGGKKLNPASNGFTAKGLLGAFVEYWYVEKSSELVYASIDVDQGNTLTLTYDQLVTGSSEFSLTNVVYYDEHDKQKNARIAMVADFVYNGGAFNTYTLDDLKIESGYMTLIDRNEDKIFDVVNVTEYKDYLIGGISKEENVIYVKSASIELDKYNVANIVNINNSGIEIGDLAVGSLISVAASKDNTNITVVYCGAPATGVVTKAETTENIYYLGEKAYELSNGFVASASASDYPEVGDNYKFHLNADGDVAEIEYLDSDAWYKGYLVGIAPESGSALDTVAVAGIVGANGELVKYFLTSKITLNGERVNGADVSTHAAVYDSEAKMPLRQPVKYKLDEWGELRELETPVNNIGAVVTDGNGEPVLDENGNTIKKYPYDFDNENFSKDRHYDTALWKGDSVNAIQGIYFVSTSSLVVCDPYLDDPEGAYKYDDVEIIPNSVYKTYSGITYADLYEIDEANNVGYVIFRETNAGSSAGEWQRSLMVVESVYRALEVDEDGDSEEVKVVAGALSGKKVTYYEDKEKFVIPDTLRNGDVCLTEINGSHLTNLRVLTNISDHTYDADGNEVYQPPLASGAIYGGDSFVNQELNVFAGPIYGASTTGVVILGWNDNYKLLGTSNNGTNAKAMTIYDRETGKVTVGSRQDIYTNIVPDANEEAQPDDYTPRAVIYRRYDYIVDMIFVK